MFKVSNEVSYHETSNSKEGEIGMEEAHPLWSALSEVSIESNKGMFADDQSEE